MHIVIVPSEHFVTARYPFGAIFQFHQATALARAAHQVGVVASGVVSPRFLLRSYPYSPREQVHGFSVFRRYRRRALPQRFERLERAIAVHRALGLGLFREYVGAHGVPDVIHAHNMLFAGFVAQAIRDAHGVPYVITEHSSAYARGQVGADYKAAVASCARDAAAMTVVSRSLADDIARVVADPAIDIGVLQNTIDPLLLSGSTGEEPARGREFVFLTVGSLDSNKDHATLIAAFARQFTGSNATLRIGGEGALRADLERRAAALGVADRVTFLGQLDRAQVRREMQHADCFVLASRYETFGVVLIEALALGTPVVSTRCGGPLDIVNGTNGLLADPEDATGLGDAMRRLYERRGEYRRDAIRHDCIDRFGEQAFVKAAMRYYARAAAA
jgi:glycosyltransferase involved in cell wall biosynthesis